MAETKIDSFAEMDHINPLAHQAFYQWKISGVPMSGTHQLSV
jgi:hypothetical protein